MTVETSTTLTKEERRKLLRENGFVRVDGLTAFGPGPDEETVIGDIGDYHLNTERDLGRWDYNNGVYAVVTTDREIWVSAGNDTGNINFSSLFEFVAPNDQGCFVPCSNGEWPSAYNLLARVADPDYQPK